MPGIIYRNDKEYIATDFIDDVGLGVIGGHIEVYMSIYFPYRSGEHTEYLTDTESPVYFEFYLRDKENYYGESWICSDVPSYCRNRRAFSLSAGQREEFIELLAAPQFYGLSGWEFCMSTLRHECSRRKISFDPVEVPDYGKLPVKEEGFRTDVEKWYCEALDELTAIEETPVFEIENGLFIVAIPMNRRPKEGCYFKVMQVDMSDPEEDFEERGLRAWCRISMERPEYITGYDENLVLTGEQLEKMVGLFNTAPDVSRVRATTNDSLQPQSRWNYLVHIYANDLKVSGAEYRIDPELPMPDYSSLLYDPQEPVF